MKILENQGPANFSEGLNSNESLKIQKIDESLNGTKCKHLEEHVNELVDS